MLDNKVATQQKVTQTSFSIGMMKSFFSLVFLLFIILIFTENAFSEPPTLEIYAGSGSGQGPTANSGTHTFLLNKNNPSDNIAEPYTPNTTVSYQITNSVYNTAVYADKGSNQPELMFGGTPRNSTVVSTDILQALNLIGSAQSNMFAASLQNAPAGCNNNGGSCLTTNGGIDAGTNQGVSFLAMAKSLRNVNGANRSRVKIGTVEITFNRPITNPILQVSGLGGTTGYGLGFSAEFTLTNSNTAVTLRRIAGNSNFAVDGNNIINTSTTINSLSTSGNGGASGSVYIKGKSIRSLTFDVYMRGDAGGDYTAGSGDAFFFGISSMDADSDLSIVKSQRVGTSGNFAQNQLNVPLNSTIQYQLLISNNKPQNATVGGSVYLAPFTDAMPSNLKDVKIVDTKNDIGAACSPTLSGNTLNGTFSGSSGTTCTITLQATAAVEGNITNTATIAATSTDQNTANDSSSVNTIITYPEVTADPEILEARFSINPNIPIIERGRIGTQLIDIKNEGPNNATNSVAIYTASPQKGVTVIGMSVVDGAVCTVNGNNWSCPLGGISNGAIKQLSVRYSTTGESALGVAQQASIKVSSDEFNPGSGVGETLYKVWGTNEQNEIRKNGAFWVGYEGTGGTEKVGDYSDEKTSIQAAWPINQISPIGGYLVNSGNGVRDSVYAASSKNAPPMTQRIINNISADPNSSVNLPYIGSKNNGDVIGDNRRAWEFTTGLYIPNKQAVTVCIGNNNLGIDDSGYIMVDGVVVSSIDGYISNGILAKSDILASGYHRITYRIANRNNYSSNERSAGGYGAIGLSLTGDCSTASYDNATNLGIPVNIQITDGAKIKIAKNSINGVDIFNFSNLTNLMNKDSTVTTDSVTTVTAGTAVSSTQQLWAKLLGNDVSLTENNADGYVLSSVSCIDANSANTGNTGMFWRLSNNTAIIPAERIKEGANITCTFTNTKQVFVSITGRVFTDNSGTTRDVSKAYNGIQDTGETGIANTMIKLSNCSTTQLALGVTNANGDYSFSIDQSVLPSSFCIAKQNLAEYISVSGTKGYNRSTDTITLNKTDATSYTENNFGDVIQGVILHEDGQHTVVAGDVTDYPHRLTAQTPVQLTQLLQVQTQQPSSSIDQPWQALVYRDSNCNGQVDSGETVFNPTQSNTILLQPNTEICLVQRVHAPKNVIAGAQHIGELQASYQINLANPVELISAQTIKRKDITLIGSAGLNLTKKVRAVSACPSTASDTNVFTTKNEVAQKDYLEYEITYKNSSTKRLQNVKVKDSLPIGTKFGSMECNVTPNGNTCNANHANSDLEWSLTGLLNPQASGTLRFCVIQSN
ncbi:hypothetical protein [Acinetobacter nectaris]|uniref:prealbumin-like fold domain-containing protein n=1 Tax=Acinetobacter nectaris TaxID=1219382 RepID=UPI001F31F36B|nr:hypothetical protein [Acinetobacter nectaris]MCF9046957.1 DUF11 domain-containing protein [Acinetobacter nectaris]